MLCTNSTKAHSLFVKTMAINLTLILILIEDLKSWCCTCISWSCSRWTTLPSPNTTTSQTHGFIQVWVWRSTWAPLLEGEHAVGDAEHQALGVDGLAGVGALIPLLHVPDHQGTVPVVAGHRHPAGGEGRGQRSQRHCGVGQTLFLFQTFTLFCIFSGVFECFPLTV